MKPRRATFPLEREIHDALAELDSAHVNAAWRKAQERLSSDPDGAITCARAMLESVCKHVLDKAGIAYEDDWTMNALYKRAATVLDIAPSRSTEQVLNQILGGCTSVVEGVGALRSRLGDAHGKGKAGAMADAGHAELAVDLAGAVARFVSVTWQRQRAGKTVGELIERYLVEEHPRATYAANLRALKRQRIATKNASKLKVHDIIDHCRSRGRKVKPATVNLDISCLRTVLRTAQTRWALDVSPEIVAHTRPELEKLRLIGRSTSRSRTLNDDEYERLLSRLRERDRGSKIPVALLVEFIVYSARRIGEVCELRWEDIVGQTCLVRDMAAPRKGRLLRPHRFPLRGRAWEIVKKQRKTGDPRIFPYNPKTVGVFFRDATKAVGIRDLRLDDLRREAATRLIRARVPLEDVAEITGHVDLRPLQRLRDKWFPKSSPMADA